MAKYVERHKCDYKEGRISKTQFVKAIYDDMINYSRGEQLTKRGIEALLELSKKKSPNEPISLDEISTESGITSEQTSTRGLWPWLQAGIVGFVITDEFYPELVKIVKK